MATPRQCCDCRDGEHDNYDDNVKMVTIRDSETGKVVKRGYVCANHVTMYLDDGYKVS